MVVAVILVVFLIDERIRKSPYGRVIKAIREDDLVAQTLGKDVLRTRVQIFALGAFFMGLAGSLNAHYIQHISPDAYTTSIAIIIWMSVIVEGASTFAVMVLNPDFTKSTVDAFNTSALGNGLTQVQEPFYYNGGQSSYRAEVSKLIEKNPDLAFIPSLVTDFTAVYKELYRQGYEGKVLAVSIATGSKFIDAVGDAADGVLHGLPIPNLGSPAYKHYLSMLKLEDNGGVQHPFGTADYDQMTTLLLATAKAGASDGPTVANAIHQVSNGAGTPVHRIEDGLDALAAGEEINFSGASSTVEFDSPSGVLSSRDFGFWKIEGGKNTLLSTAKS